MEQPTYKDFVEAVKVLNNNTVNEIERLNLTIEELSKALKESKQKNIALYDRLIVSAEDRENLTMRNQELKNSVCSLKEKVNEGYNDKLSS